MVLSDRCQTHQSCAFLCALSNGVYCTTRSSGSQCLHVCPWWEYNVSGRFASLLAENTRLGRKTMCHDPFYLAGNRLVSNAELPCVNVTAKLNRSGVALLRQTQPVYALTATAWGEEKKKKGGHIWVICSTYS